MGLSQSDLARLLNTSRQAINRYENSEREPNIKTAKAFADKLGVPLSDLCGDGSTEDATEIEKKEATKAIKEIHRSATRTAKLNGTLFRCRDYYAIRDQDNKCYVLGEKDKEILDMLRFTSDAHKDDIIAMLIHWSK